MCKKNTKQSRSAVYRKVKKMDKNNEFMDFCSSEYAEKLFKSFSNITNYAALCYRNSDDILKMELTANLKNNSNDGKISEEDLNSCLESVNLHSELTGNICCILQRVSVLCSAILTKQPDLHQIRSVTYLRNFAYNCQRILGGKCKINVISDEDFIFSSLRELLDIILLHFIRNACRSASDSENGFSDPVSFELSAYIKNRTPEITVNTNVHMQHLSSDTIDTMDFFEIFSNEITETIAAKLDIKTEIGSSHMIIKFPADSADDRITAEQPRKQLINEGNSIFRIMLGDL